jgi:hypothetical protein
MSALQGPNLPTRQELQEAWNAQLKAYRAYLLLHRRANQPNWRQEQQEIIKMKMRRRLAYLQQKEEERLIQQVRVKLGAPYLKPRKVKRSDRTLKYLSLFVQQKVKEGSRPPPSG